MYTRKITNYIKTNKIWIYLGIILVLGFYLRTFNIDWDNNYYFHPDERAIAMFTIPLKFPKNISEFLSPSSPLNPHFFAYGNLPLYLLKILSVGAGFINPIYKIYGGIHIIGRLISALADTGTIFIIFLLGQTLFSKRSALFAALLYCLSVFPIQTSHFYAVDTLLTFSMLSTIYFLTLFLQKKSIKKALLVGIFLGLSFAIKISSLILLIDAAVALILAINTPHEKKGSIFPLVIYGSLVIAVATIIFIITQPYTILDFQEFISQTGLQTQMSNNPFIFPYTLQYVGKVPYYYELKNIFLWGQGPLLALLCISGILIAALKALTQKIRNKKLIGFALFFTFSYFLVFGKFAVGWMRYMLPIYPLLSVFGGYFVSDILIRKIPKKFMSSFIVKKSLLFIFVLLAIIYPISFMSIYLHQNTRIQASDWINANIPPGKHIAVEHWDDALPVSGAEQYTQLTLPLYDPDTSAKWEGIKSTLLLTDYIIIASNRLYVPLQKLTDCKVLPAYRCYPLTSVYYKKLFDGTLGFKKVAEFTDYPTIPFTNIHLVDDSSDESFTVYDHPKIMIFKKD